MRMTIAVLTLLCCSLVCSAQDLSNPAYVEGFGKDVTGGQGHPVCTVTASIDECFSVASSYAQNVIIHFAGASATVGAYVHYVGSNVTIDGCANGQNGVDLNQQGTDRRPFVIKGPESNIILRCLGFRGDAVPNGGGTNFDLVAVDGRDGQISGVLIDRCTFEQATDGALDITGWVRDVTVQRSLFHGHATALLIKYDTRERISFHHNVLTRSGERNPQIKGDITNFDFVSNVNYLHDVSHDPYGVPVYPQGLRIWSCGSGCDSQGNVQANVVASAFVEPSARIELLNNGGSNDNVYIAPDNYCVPNACPASPSATPNPIAAGFEITPTPVDQMSSLMLLHVGSPSRTAEDQQYLDAVATVLPGAPPGPTYRADLTWPDNSADEDGFRVERSDTIPSAVWTLIGQVVADVTTFSDAGLVAGAGFCWRIVAFNTGGEEISPETCATTPSPVDPPAAPGAPQVIFIQE